MFDKKVYLVQYKTRDDGEEVIHYTISSTMEIAVKDMTDTSDRLPISDVAIIHEEIPQITKRLFGENWRKKPYYNLQLQLGLACTEDCLDDFLRYIDYYYSHFDIIYATENDFDNVDIISVYEKDRDIVEKNIKKILSTRISDEAVSDVVCNKRYFIREHNIEPIK